MRPPHSVLYFCENAVVERRIEMPRIVSRVLAGFQKICRPFSFSHSSTCGAFFVNVLRQEKVKNPAFLFQFSWKLIDSSVRRKCNLCPCIVSCLPAWLERSYNHMKEFTKTDNWRNDVQASIIYCVNVKIRQTENVKVPTQKFSQHAFRNSVHNLTKPKCLFPHI